MHDFPWWKYLNYHLHYQNKHKHKIVLDTPLLSPLRLCDKWWTDMIKNGYHLLNIKPFWHQITIRHLAKVKLGMGFSSVGGVSSSTQASQTDLNQSKLIQLVWPFHLEVFGWISKEKKNSYQFDVEFGNNELTWIELSAPTLYASYLKGYYFERQREKGTTDLTINCNLNLCFWSFQPSIILPLLLFGWKFSFSFSFSLSLRTK